MKERFFTFTFPEDLVREPVLYSLVRRYNLTPHVFKASVTNTGGWLIVQIVGDNEAIDAAVLDLECRGALVREGGRELLELDAPQTAHSVRVRLTLPQEKITDPYYSRMIKEHDVVINIRQAKIDPERGVMDIEISGTLESIDSAIESLKKEGIGVGPIEGNVIE